MSVQRSASLAALVVGVAISALPAAAADIRVDGLGARRPERILVFVVRGEGVETPVVAFQERARQVLEEHTYARVVSMEEAFVRGGAAFQKRLAECRGDDRCYARLVGSVDAGFLLVLVASDVGDETVIGSRFIDLQAMTALGNAVDTVPIGDDPLVSLPDQIKGSIPETMWDPFGWLQIKANVPAAEVSVDGRVVGITPVERIGHLLPGQYAVTASKPGHAPAESTGVVTRGETTDVALRLEPEGSGSGWLLWTIIGVVAVAGASAAVLVSTSGSEPTFCSSPDPNACP